MTGFLILWERAAGDFAFPLFVAQIALAVPSGLDSSSLSRTLAARYRKHKMDFTQSGFYLLACREGVSGKATVRWCLGEHA